MILASTPILTRLFTPTDFGILAVFISILGVVPVVANFRYDIAISLSKDKQESFHTLALCFLGTTLCTAAVAGVFISGVLNTVDTEFSSLQPYGWIVAVGTFAVGVFTALNAWVGYAQKFDLVAKVKVRQAVSSIITQVGFGLLTTGPLGLLIGYVISQSYGATSFAAEVLRARPKGFGLRDIYAAAKKYRSFLLFAFPAGVVNRLGIHLIPVLIGAFYTITAAGFFLLAQRLVALPTLVIGRSVAQVYTNRLAKDSLRRDVRLLPTYLRTVLALSAAGVVPMAILLAFSPSLFQFIFGSEWRIAGVFCQLLVPAFYAQFVVSPMIQTLNVLGYQKTQLVWDCARLLLVISVFLIGDHYEYDQTGAVVAISASLTVAYVLQFLLSVWAIGRHDKNLKN